MTTLESSSPERRHPCRAPRRRDLRGWGLAVLVATLVVGCAPDRLPGESSFRDVRARAAQSESVADEILLARIDGRDLTLGQFDRRVAALPAVARQLFDTPERRVSLLELLVQLEVIAEDARHRGMVEGPIEAWFVAEAEAILELEAERRGAQEVLSLGSFDEAVLARAWEEEVVPWLASPSRMVMTLVAPDASTAHAWLDEMLALQRDSRATALEVFRGMARERSLDRESGARGGEVAWVRQPREGQATTNWAPLVDAVFRLGNAGDYGGPIETARGWEIVTFGGVRRAFDVTEDTWQGVLRERLYTQARAGADREHLDALRARVVIERDAAAIASLEASRLAPPPGRVARRWDVDGIARSPAAFLPESERARMPTADTDPRLHVPALAPERLAPAPSDDDASAAHPESE